MAHGLAAGCTGGTGLSGPENCGCHTSGKTGIGKALPRQWEFQDPKMKGSVPYKALFCGDIPLHCHIMPLILA